jgi:hypothetical protein
MPTNNPHRQAPKRDPRGRFMPGSVGGPGRLPLVQEQVYLARLHERMSLEDWECIVDRAIADAKEGNWRARQWLADYCLGRPAAQAPLVDNRQVNFDLSNVSQERLAAALQLAQLVHAPGRVLEAEPE